MKAVVVKNEEVKVFKPFTVNLTLETKEETLALWHRVNIGFNKIRQIKDYNPSLVFPAMGADNLDSYHLYSALSDEMKKQGCFK